MDTFSLHHFIIRHGVTLDSTPEYASYQRKYAADWGALQQLVERLEALMSRYAVPLAYVDGQKLAALALDPLAEQDERAMVECLVNKDQVAACMALPGQRYRSGAADAETAAATQLQAVVRGKLARSLARQMEAQALAADSLTRRAKVFVAQHEAERRLADDAAAKQARWERLVNAFRADWPRIRDKPRVIIHLGSISASAAQRASIPDLDVRQNCQLPRLCDVKEAGVDVVYVAPFPLNEDITHYFQKVRRPCARARKGGREGGRARGRAWGGAVLAVLAARGRRRPKWSAPALVVQVVRASLSTSPPPPPPTPLAPWQVLEIGGVSEPAKRVKIVVPENHARLPSSLSLTTALLYSPKALRKIATFCKGKPAYIVPSVVGPEERKLALELNLPLLAPEPQTAGARPAIERGASLASPLRRSYLVCSRPACTRCLVNAALYTSKSGAKRIFAAGQVNTPPGMHDLYDEPSLVAGLAQLMWWVPSARTRRR